MVALRRFLLLTGVTGSLLYILVSSYTRNMSDINGGRIHQRQVERKQLLRELCHADKKVFPGNHSLKDLSPAELEHFIVNDKHRIIYCFIPKVACTNWKRFMFVLQKSKPYPDLASIDRNKVHNPNVFSRLSHFPKAEVEVKLKNYTKFMFVRDPFVRLISAYRDKLQDNKAEEYFYEGFTKVMLKLYGNQPNPPKTLREAFASGVHPSFYNFIQYLLDPETQRKMPFEPHWRQMYRLCHPCLIEYDFIGHQETLQEDSEELLKILNLDGDIKFPPSYENMTSPDSVANWFRMVPLEDRRKLYKLYETDFKLFGYRRPNELLDG